MEKVSFPVSVEYVNAVKKARRFLSSLPYVEYHHDPLTYEEIQAVDAKLLRLNDYDVYNEYAAQKAGIEVVRTIFRELLEDGHNTDNWRNATPSLYYDEEKIVDRLRIEGRDERYIDFYTGQLYKLQQTIMERTECIREMVQGWEGIGDNDYSDNILGEEVPDNIVAYTWLIPMASVTSFSPIKAIADKKILKLLQNHDYGIFPDDLPVEYLRWAIRHAQFGKLYKYAELMGRKSDFKMVVQKIVKAYFKNNSEYLHTALLGMGIESQDRYVLERVHLSMNGEMLFKQLNNIL